jgi:hypothetical protein
MSSVIITIIIIMIIVIMLSIIKKTNLENKQYIQVSQNINNQTAVSDYVKSNGEGRGRGEVSI